MSNIHDLKLAPRPAMPADFPDVLRSLALLVEKGEITEMVIAMVHNDGYSFIWPSSMADSLVLTTLAQATAIDKLRKGP